MMNINQEKYKIVIKPNSGWFELHLSEVFQYRDLILLFVKRNFVAQYKQTILGPVWAIIQPLMTTFVFTFIFGNIAGLADCGQVPSFLFYMCGNITWGYFAGCFTGTANTFVSNSGIMGKVYFPRLVMPISIVITQFISFAIQFTMFLVLTIIFYFNPNYVLHSNFYIVMFPLFVFQMAMLGLGFGIIVSALTTKYRDLAMLVSFGVQLWMYLTPVAYSLSIFKNSFLYKLIMINPMTPIIESMRFSFLGSEAGVFNLQYYGVSWGITCLILCIGILLFSKVEKSFMDTI